MKPVIPPALVAFLCGFAMWGVGQVCSPDWLTFALPLWIYWCLFGLGATIIMLALLQFIKQQTTVDPHNLQKSTSLVSSGIYRFSRNPMYLAMLIFLFAFGLKLGNILAFLLLPFFVWYMNTFQIRHEEVAMQQKFGSAYVEYTEQVRRWV